MKQNVCGEVKKYFVCACLLFYALATSKVIWGCIPTCDGAPSWRLYSAVSPWPAMVASCYKVVTSGYKVVTSGYKVVTSGWKVVTSGRKLQCDWRVRLINGGHTSKVFIPWLPRLILLSHGLAIPDTLEIASNGWPLIAPIELYTTNLGHCSYHATYIGKPVDSCRWRSPKGQRSHTGHSLG